MRTTYGSPLFGDHVPDGGHAARRAPAPGRRDRHRQDEHAGVRRRLADVQRRLRRHPQPVRPRAHARRRQRRRGGRGRRRDAPVRRRLRPRRERPQPGRVLQPRRPAPLAGPGPRPWPRRRVEPAAACSARSRARVPDVALLLRRLAGPDPRAPLVARTSRRTLRLGPAVDPRGAADRLEPRPRRPAGRARGHRACWRRGRAALEATRLRRRGRRARLHRRRRGLRGAARRRLRAAFGDLLADQRDGLKDTIAWNVRFGLALTAPRVGAGAGAATEMFHRMRAFLERYDVLARRSPRSRRSPSRAMGRARSPACRWAPTSSGSARARGSRSPRTRRWRSRPASPPDGLPVGLQLVGRHRGEPDLLRLAAGIERATAAGQRAPVL